jgi:hypothetical protein
MSWAWILGRRAYFWAKEIGCGRTQKNLGRAGEGWDDLGVENRLRSMGFVFYLVASVRLKMQG